MMAADSMRPLPSALATTTLPAATASTMPENAEQRLTPQLKRVAVAVVHAAQNDVDLLKAVDGLEVDVAVADRHVRRLRPG